MSLSSTHRSSFVKTAPAFKSNLLRNPLVEGTHVSHDSVIYPIKLDIPANQVPDITSSGTAARKSIIKLPRNGHLKHVFLKVAFGTTGVADYLDHLGVGCMQDVELKSRSKKVQEITDPRTWLIYALSKLESDARLKMLLTMGGTSIGSVANAPTIMVWLPFFFDDFVSPNIAPLNLNQLDSDLEVHVTFKQNTSLLKATATGGSISQLSAVCWMLEADQQIENIQYKSWHVDNIVFESAIADATETEFDLKGVAGNSKKLFIVNELTTNLAIDFYLLSNLDSIKDKVNNNEEDIFLAEREGMVDNIIFTNGHGNTEARGYPYEVPYTSYEKGYQTNHLGGIDGSHINQHVLKLQHSLGAESKVSIMAIVSAMYVHAKGAIAKVE